MRRGGPRRLRVPPNELRVYACGNRGRHRVRVTQCWAVLRAEDVYTALLRDNLSRLRPGAAGTATWHVEGRELNTSWEVRQNAVWRRGRVFLRCARCNSRCTRLYVPLADSSLECRRCWGLTYASRTLQNYKDSVWGRGVFARVFGVTQRDWALERTDENRFERRERSRERWATRREFLRAVAVR